MPVLTSGRSGLASGNSGGVIVPRAVGGLYVRPQIVLPSSLNQPLGLFGNAGFDGGPYYDLIKADGATSLWRFDERFGLVAIDSIGGLHGQYIAGPTLGVAGGVVGDPDTAAGFDGGAQTVKVLANAGLDLPAGFAAGGGGFSFDGLIRKTDAGDNGWLMAKGSQFPGIFITTTNLVEFDSYAWQNMAIANTAFDFVNWHHFGVTKSPSIAADPTDGSQWLVYLNGVDVTTVVNTTFGSTINTANDLYLGSDATPANFLHADLDDLAYYRGVTLTPSQMANHAATAGHALAAAGYPFLGGGFYP